MAIPLLPRDKRTNQSLPMQHTGARLHVNCGLKEIPWKQRKVYFLNKSMLAVLADLHQASFLKTPQQTSTTVSTSALWLRLLQLRVYPLFLATALILRQTAVYIYSNFDPMTRAEIGAELVSYGIDSFFKPWYFDGKTVYWGVPQDTRDIAIHFAHRIKHYYQGS